MMKYVMSSVMMIIVSKSKSLFKKNHGRSKLPYFHCGDDILYDFNAFYEQRLNCIFSVHAIRTAHDYFIIVTHMLHFSAKNIIMCFSDKRLLLFTAIVAATILVCK